MTTDTTTREQRNEVYRRAQRTWGHEAQLNKAAEEFGELAATINRALNDQADAEELLEEMADAQLMLEQLQTDFTDEAVDTAVAEAIDSLEGRLP